jgi:hypothetical protein
VTPTGDRHRRYALAAMAAECEAVASAAEGQRNDQLNRAAFALGQLVAGGVLERDEVEEQLLAAALHCGLPESEASRTIASGLGVGLQQPRTAPDPERPVRRDSAPEPAKASGRRAVTVRLSDVEPEAVQWLWAPYIPLGKLTLLEGDPGLGKTWLALTIAASVTRGDPFPNEEGVPRGHREPANVLYLSAEDGLADTLRPRLDAVGADVSRVIALTGWQATDDNGEPIEGAVTLGDKDVLEQVLNEYRPALVVVDPLQAYLGASVDMHRANETRPLLSLLGQLAERYRCAVLAIRHLSKAPQGRTIYRGLGTIDFAAAARSILLVAEHPENDQLRVIAHTKSSLAPAGKSLAYELRDNQLLWAGSVELSAEQLLAPRQSDDERSARDEAREFLLELLADGVVPVKEVKRAARDAELSWRTIERAKGELGVTASRQGETGNRGGGQWVWSLPTRTHTRGGLNRDGINAVTDDNSLRPPSKTGGGLNNVRQGRENSQLIKTANTMCTGGVDKTASVSNEDDNGEVEL